MSKQHDGGPAFPYYGSEIIRDSLGGALCWAVIIGLVAGGAVVGRWIVAAFGAAVGG